MPLHEKKVIAVLPAYNAERTLRATYDDIPQDWVDEILLVDDCSRDRTVELSRELGLKTVVHQKNRGYGGNQKTCYRTAMDEMGGEIMVMVHPDHQYDPKIIPELVKPLLRGEAEAVFGDDFGVVLVVGMDHDHDLAAHFIHGRAVAGFLIAAVAARS